QQSWHMAAYFATLIAGGIALFIPGPWLVSYLFHYDFTTSFLIFMSLVNIHHFILDGRLWKLRDSRVSSLLVDRSGKASPVPASSAVIVAASSRAAVDSRPSMGLRVLSAPAFRISLAGLLFLWGGLDQLHFSLRTDDGNLSALLRAAKINPYDSAVQARIARAESQSGKRDEAVAALTRAIEINPNSIALQQACARAMIEDGRYADAYAHYQRMLEQFPRDADSLVNYGLLAARLGHPDEAMDAWEKSVDVNPNQPNVHVYLAEAFDQRGEFAAASRHWNAFLQLAGTQATAASQDPALGREQMISATIQLADDEARTNHPPAALTGYNSAIALAQKAKDAKLEGLALAHRADLQDKSGDITSAAQSYQSALSVDSTSGDPRSEAFDWFNYGQFLRRHNQPDEIVYACFLHAENLLAASGGSDLNTVQGARRQVASKIGKKADNVQRELPEFLIRATALTLASH
ncbi:MAG: tetratricopeptide repeat protein, partial [Candidatus Acidiferrales bacterium]